MKRFFQFIEQTTGEKWDYMKKPKKELTAVDEFGRTMNLPSLPKAEPEPREAQTTKPVSSMKRNADRLAAAPKGTEGRAEYNLRRQNQDPGHINMLPRRLGPETDPEKEQYDTVDHQVLKKNTQDQMPEVNVDEPRPKIKRRM